MAASATDYFTEVGNPGTATTLAAPGHSISGTTFTVTSTTNWPVNTGVVFAVDTFTLQTVNGVPNTAVRTPGSYTEWEGVVVSSTSITGAVLRYGTDQNYSAGANTRVYIPVASSRENRLAQGIQVQHNQDGTHGVVTATSVSTPSLTVSTTATFPTGSIAPTALGTAIPASKLAMPYNFRVYLNGAQNTINGSSKILFDSKSYDTGSNVDVVTNKGRFTVPVNGFYDLSATTEVVSTASLQISLYKNGSQASVGTTSSGSGTNPGSIVFDKLQLVAGDYIEVYVTTGTAVAIFSGSISTYFSGNLISTT